MCVCVRGCVSVGVDLSKTQPDLRTTLRVNYTPRSLRELRASPWKSHF